MSILTLDYFHEGATSDAMADELERVAELLRGGFTSGELMAGKDAGWWNVTDLAEEDADSEDHAI